VRRRQIPAVVRWCAAGLALCQWHAFFLGAIVTEPTSSHQQRHVFYSGHVQGVGFRYVVQNIARGLDVTGFVKNLSDGRVELLAEGPPAELDNLLEEIAARLGPNIRKVQTVSGPATQQFVDFRIRF
jgi:acylphosphatase